MTRLLVATLTVVVVTLPGHMAFAQGWPGGGGRNSWLEGGPMLPMLIKGGELTDAQRGQVKQIVANHRPQFEGLVKQLRAARETLDTRLFGKDAVTAADVTPTVQQISQLRSQLMQESLLVALEIRNIMTPDQLAKAAQFRERLSALRQEMQSLVGR